MAEVQQNDGGKGKGKGHQKKMQIRVDFTPMVDMNMLLITFFMLCTTMIKSQTLTIALPSNDPNTTKNPEQMNQASEKDAITIIIDVKRKPGKPQEIDSVDHKVVPVIYYYYGKPANGNMGSPEELAANNNLQQSELLSNDANGKARGIREIIQKRNKAVLDKINALKKQYQDGKFGSLETKDGREKAQAKYNELAKEIRNDDKIENKPVIIIKSTPEASFGSLVSILDEMQINSISKYQIDNMTEADKALLGDYLMRHQ